MKSIDAIIKILEEAHKPLHVQEITEKLLNEGLWQTSGKTPADTIGAKLYSHVKKHGEHSPFIKVAPQIFALREKKKNDNDAELTSVHDEKQTGNSGLSFTDCAQKVLDVFGKKKPMHYREITQRALDNGWLVTNGKTPAATMYAQIITEIKRQQGRGEQPRFIRLGRGEITLSQWTEDGLSFQIEQHNERIGKALREKLMSMSAEDFEGLISILLAEMGFKDIEVTKRSHDGGIDVRGTLIVADSIHIRMAIQAKKWNLKNNVQAPVVQQVRGSLGAHEQGLIITTSDFSSGAVKEATQANKTPIALINGKQLVLLLMEHNLGVQGSTLKIFHLDEDSLLMKAAEK